MSLPLTTLRASQASTDASEEECVLVVVSDDWCNALYFPYGRRKGGGVFCRLEPDHAGDHWCEAEDEMDPEHGDD